VKITGEVTGLSNGLYGFHIHDFGDNTNSCKTTGLHLYPHKTDLGARTDPRHHSMDILHSQDF